MAYRLILDENVEHEVFHRLENYGTTLNTSISSPNLGRGLPTIQLRDIYSTPTA